MYKEHSVVKVVIDESRCKGCALCTVACPLKLITLSSAMNSQGFFPARIDEKNMQRCISCALCARMCPDASICVYRERSADERQAAVGHRR